MNSVSCSYSAVLKLLIQVNIVQFHLQVAIMLEFLFGFGFLYAFSLESATNSALFINRRFLEVVWADVLNIVLFLLERC